MRENQRVIIYGPNLPGPTETFHVHAEGCADTKRGIYRGIRVGGDQGGWSIEAASVQEVVEEVYADIMDENGDTWEDYLSEFKVFPCVTLPTETVVVESHG